MRRVQHLLRHRRRRNAFQKAQSASLAGFFRRLARHTTGAERRQQLGPGSERGRRGTGLAGGEVARIGPGGTAAAAGGRRRKRAQLSAARLASEQQPRCGTASTSCRHILWPSRSSLSAKGNRGGANTPSAPGNAVGRRGCREARPRRAALARRSFQTEISGSPRPPVNRTRTSSGNFLPRSPCAHTVAPRLCCQSSFASAADTLGASAQASANPGGGHGG